MRGREPDPHVGVHTRHPVQQVREPEPPLLGPVDGLKPPAELGRVGAAELLLRRVPVAVDVLTQQGHLLHTLNTTIHTGQEDRLGPA